MKKSLCKSYYSEDRTTDDDPIRTIVNYGRDVIRNYTEGVNHYSLIDLITSENLISSSIINSIQLAATNRSTNKSLIWNQNYGTFLPFKGPVVTIPVEMFLFSP
jgi:hypothetical protein